MVSTTTCTCDVLFMLKKKNWFALFNKADELFHMLKWLDNKVAGGGRQIRGENCMLLSNKSTLDKH